MKNIILSFWIEKIIKEHIEELDIIQGYNK
jgi:hypothetical protein